MLTSKDLMIGDWYAFRGHPYKCTASDIEALAECEEKGVPTDISEIPITAEILEKNGFDISDQEVKQYHFEEDGQRYHFSLRQMYNQKDGKPNGYSFFAFSVLTIIDYVHELQHCLKLVGINKEIIL